MLCLLITLHKFGSRLILYIGNPINGDKLKAIEIYLFVCPDLEVFSLKANVLLLNNGEWAALIWAFTSGLRLSDTAVLQSRCLRDFNVLSFGA